MKKKKQGFTLVELLCVLVILALLALLIGSSVVKSIASAKEEISETQEKAILNAAEKWSVENSQAFDDIDGSTISIGLDVVFVLDFSGSMGFARNYMTSSSGTKISRYQAMVEAIDVALSILITENADTRISLVSFKDKVNVLLPLDRYTTTGSNYITWTSYGSVDDWGTIKFPTLYNSSGSQVTSTYTMSNGVTYTQGGIIGGANVLLNNSDVTNRIPVIILLTDGAPSAYTTGSYTEKCTVCNGDWNDTAARYAVEAAVTYKEKVKEHYESNTALFYTVGIGISEGSAEELVLNPTKTNINASTTVTNRATLANYLKSHNGSDAYDYADRAFVDVFDATSLKTAFSTISQEVVEAAKITEVCVTVEDLYNGGYLSTKEVTLANGQSAEEYVIMSMNDATNQYSFSLAKTEEQKQQCKNLLEQSSN